ncbi:Gfo/Idh/MocA family protein [Radicibacter daui]|uniref:Gfo/Idh/MocA family protein n=1 Tax=Radicibacter daui TaxID=3064829 RepID=UPI004046FB2A
MTEFRWGILGAARIAERAFIPAVRAGREGEVVAVAARSGERARSYARQHGITRSHEGYEALLADPEVDGVYIPLPNDVHVRLAIAALEAGKHVLVEKPVGLNAGEVEKLIAARDATGKLALDGLMVRHHPQWQKARALIRDGRIGALKSVQAAFSFGRVSPEDYRLDASKGGGALLDIGIYCITAARYFFGEEPEAVIGQLARGPLGADHAFDGMMRFSGGRQASFTTAIDRVNYQRVHAFGETGHIQIAMPFNAPNGGLTRLYVSDGDDLPGLGEAIAIPPANQYALLVDGFARAARGQEVAPWPLEDALATARIMDAFFRSTESGKWESP